VVDAIDNRDKLITSFAIKAALAKAKLIRRKTFDNATQYEQLTQLEKQTVKVQ